MCQISDEATLVAMVASLAVSIGVGVLARNIVWAAIMQVWTNPDVSAAWKRHIARVVALIAGIAIWASVFGLLLSQARSALCG